MVYLADWLRPQESGHLGLALPLLPVYVEIFSLGLVVLVGLLFVVESIPLFVDLPLREDTWFYVDLFLSFWVQIDLNCVVSFSWVIGFFLLVEVSGVVELIPDLRIQLSRRFDFLWPEDPLWHL